MSRWAIEQRLEWIRVRIVIWGHINRAQIVEHFGISVPQASTDLRRAQERWPDLMIYDRSAKRYRERTRQEGREIDLSNPADKKLARQREELKAVVQALRAELRAAQARIRAFERDREMVRRLLGEPRVEIELTIVPSTAMARDLLND